jgi:hypothetical protein
MILDPHTIYTDADGKPFERPECPGPDAPPAEFTAWLRADAEYRQAIRNAANHAFDKAFRKAVRR